MMTADANDSAFKHPWTPLTVVAPALVRNRDFHFWFLTRSKSDSPHTSPEPCRVRQAGRQEILLPSGLHQHRASGSRSHPGPVHKCRVAQDWHAAISDTRRARHDRATVAQSRVQILVVELEVGNSFVCFSRQDSHAKLQLVVRQCLCVFIFSERFSLL